MVLPTLDGRALYGGTPTDKSVIEAIAAIRASGKEVMFYPFILMDQLSGNGLADPWSDAGEQPQLPWRGRITLTNAPGSIGTADRTATAAAEVAAFLGAALPYHFTVSEGVVNYSGPADWGFRRFILHYANLCALTGGVDAFCIGSELRSLTQIRAAGDSFPMVQALVQLAGEVRAILGPAAKISYAADWSEYFGYHADNNVYFHLDPLWSDPNIDFIGIDNYMPLSDWQDGNDNADRLWGSIYNLDYLKANVAGGEGYDWYYDSPEGESAQLRKPIIDEWYGEHWAYRYKDIAGWWGADHHDRIDGVRSATASGWTPGLKPIRFTEYGCAALDKGTNQPNRFIDPKSSESGLPRGSSGQRDDFIQMQYLRAMHEFWSVAENNPHSHQYSGRMLDLDHCHVWAFDARPFPEFPGNSDVWADGDNYSRGHWLNGRASAVPLAALAAELCEAAGLSTDVNTANAYGVVRGYAVADIGTARAALQPLSLTYAMDAREREGQLQFYMRTGEADFTLDAARLAVAPNINGAIESSRAAIAETTGRVRLTYIEAESDYEVRSAEAVFPDETSPLISQSEVALQLTGAEARGVAERWLAEARVARDTVRFALPRSQLAVGAGSVVNLAGSSYRIDRLEWSDVQTIDAVRVDSGAYRSGTDIEDVARRTSPAASLPIFPRFMDLPLLTGDEAPQAPHVAVSASPWPGSVAIWSSTTDAGYSLNKTVDGPAIFGTTQSPMKVAMPGLWDHGLPLRVKLSTGQLSSVALLEVLNGANLAAIGDGSPENWEVFQFSHADLVAYRTYDLSIRLRGQVGTDAVLPPVWPAGSYFVLLDSAVTQINLAASARGLDRFYRIGAAKRGYSDRNIVVESLAFNGVGLRPYSVSHLALDGSAGEAITAGWLRRTRIEGDSWMSGDVPLGEDSERYLVQVLS
ncbi:MAG: glycoside hydrolase/phage tail family protein, partial [Paracoccaceae bacterium]